MLWKVLVDQYNAHSNPDGYINLGVAENRLMHKELQEHILHSVNVEQYAFTYGDGASGSHRIRKAIANFLNKHLASTVPLEPKHIFVTNGVSHAIEHTSWAFTDPDDGMLLGRPYYGAFIPDISLRPVVEVVQVSFNDMDPMSTKSVQAYE